MADKKALFRGLFDGTSDEVAFDRSGSFLEQLRRTIEPAAVRTGGRGHGEDAEEDSEALVPQMLAEVRARPGTPAQELDEAASPVAGMLSGLSIERTSDGGLRIQAPPESAGVLADLLEGLSRALRRAARN